MNTVRIIAFGLLGYSTCFAIFTMIKDSKSSFGKLCKSINKWQKETFKSADAFSKWYHLQKEVKELFTALECNSKRDIKKELADCFILLIGIAGVLKIDPETIIEDKFEIIQKRKWGKPDKNGVVEHIREGETNE